MVRHQQALFTPSGNARQPVAARALAPSAASGSWSPLGPQPIVALDTYGASAGRITSLAAKGSIIYAGSADGGVWKSTNGGAQWTPLSDGEATLAIGALAVDWTTTPETVYAGTGELNHCQDCLPTQGILKSADAGANWVLLGQSTFVGHVFGFSALVVDHPNAALAARLLAATNHGLFLSTDAGTSWSVALAGETTAVVQDPFTPTKFWAAQADSRCQAPSSTDPLYGSIALSVNSGATWTTTKIFSTLPEALRIGLAVGANATTDTAYAAVAACATNGSPSYKDGQLAAIEKTTDGAVTWTELTPGSPTTLTDYFSAGTPPVEWQGWYDNVVAVDPTNPAHAVFGGVTMLVTTDGGGSFTDVAKPYESGPLHADFHAIAFPDGAAGSKFYAGNDGGVYYTSDFGGSGVSGDWTNKNAALSITQFYSGSSLDLTHVIGGSQDNGTAGLVPGGPPPPGWVSLLDGDGGWTAQVANSPTVYAEYTDLDIYQLDLSTGAQNEMGPCAYPYSDPSCSDPVAFIAPFVRDPSSGNGVERLYGATNRIYRTTTGGQPSGGTGVNGAWTAVSNDLTAGTISFPSGPRQDVIHTLAIGSGSTAGTLMTGSWFGKVWMTTVGPTVTPGAGWKDATGNLTPFSLNSYTGNPWISALAVNPTNSGEAWVAIGTGSGARVFHSTNAGASPTTWTSVTGAMPNVVVDSLTVDPLNQSILYAGTDTGPLWCTNCGGNAPAPDWSRLGTAIPNARVDALTFTADASNLIAWTHGRGAWSMPRPVPTPQAELNPTSLNFAGQKVGTTSPSQPVTLRNRGTGPLTISGMTTTGDFGATPHCPGVLPPQASCTIDVTFSPTAAGSRTGQLSVSDDAADTPQSVALTGTGVSPWESLGGVLSSGPDASSWSNGREDVFIRGQDNALWHRSFDGSTWTGWESLGGIITADPAAVSWGDNRIDVLVRGQDRQLWHRSFDGSNGWSGWEPLGGILALAPDVASPASGRLDVFIQGQDRQLWQKSFINGAWMGWQPLGGIITSAPGAVSAAANQIDVLARGQDRQLWHRSFNGSWGGWEPLGGILASGPDASSWGGGRLDVFIEGQDRQLWHMLRSGSSWSGWQPLGGIITADPGAVSPTTGVIDVFVRGQDSALWHYGLTG